MSNGTFFPKPPGESICSCCFRTVVTTDDYPTLAQAQAAHECITVDKRAAIPVSKQSRKTPVGT